MTRAQDVASGRDAAPAPGTAPVLDTASAPDTTPALDLVAFGTVFLEVVFGHVPLPGPGEEVFADEFAVSCGGGGVTVATAASGLGLRAGLSARLGDDLGTRVVQEHCQRAGVDLSASRYVPGRVAGITVVLNFDGDRAFVSYVPPRPQEECPDADHWLEVLRRYRPAWCYLHAEPCVIGLLEEARALGVRVALDVALNDIASHPEAVVSCARRADVFLPNADELLRLTRAGSVAAALDEAVGWSRWVVVKRGADGAVVADRAGRTEVTDGIRQVEVRDRTGAGDAFAGALIGALSQGASITEAAVAGNEAGSQTVSKLGAVGEVQVEGLSAAAPLVAAVLGEAAREAAAGAAREAAQEGDAPG
ncbi:MAG: PfkB family carbohydrate kinase [Nocardiopsaceae bacterium]|nr:PfkB family carbohydrate kinase [Nocardiopsaceae bacterium]